MSAPAQRTVTPQAKHGSAQSRPSPFARILVGYLPTVQGADACRLGADLAAVCGSELSLASVVIDDGECERAASALKEAVAAIARVAGARGVARRIIASTSPARGLHDLAVSERTQLIVVGSSHRGPLGRILLGSVGERLLHGAPCAVAVAPRGHAAHASRGVRRVLVAFDGSPEAHLALRTGHRLAARTGAGLVALSVIAPSSPGTAAGEVLPFPGLDPMLPLAGAQPLEARRVAEALEHQQSAARAALDSAAASLDDGVAVEPRILFAGDAASVIVDAARAEADLLLLGSRGYGPARRALLGSVSTAVMRHASCPVLITPRLEQREVAAVAREHPNHEQAVLDAEVRLLADMLSPFGVLTRHELARRADAWHWHSGTFETALRAGARRGVIELLPDGFVALRHHPSAPRLGGGAGW